MKWIVFAMVVLLFGMLLKGSNPHFATCLGFAGAVCLAMVGVTQMKELYLKLCRCGSAMGQAGTFFPLLLKILGITYLSELAAVLSKESGFMALASQIELLGKLAVMVAGMPLVFSVMEQIKTLLG